MLGKLVGVKRNTLSSSFSSSASTASADCDFNVNYHIKNKDNALMSDSFGTMPKNSSGEIPFEHELFLEATSNNSSVSEMCIAPVLGEVKDDLVSYLRMYSSKVRDEAMGKDAEADWYFVATVIDRLLFWLFLTANVVTLSIFFWRHPDIAGDI